jgi:hypothetical protein
VTYKVVGVGWSWRDWRRESSCCTLLAAIRNLISTQSPSIRSNDDAFMGLTILLDTLRRPTDGLAGVGGEVAAPYAQHTRPQDPRQQHPHHNHDIIKWHKQTLSYSYTLIRSRATVTHAGTPSSLLTTTPPLWSRLSPLSNLRQQPGPGEHIDEKVISKNYARRAPAGVTTHMTTTPRCTMQVIPTGRRTFRSPHPQHVE